jgi:aryl-alcohol dehydrogenase-like predicted oxidoreductase
MKQRRISGLDRDVSVVGFGCWAVSGADIWNGSTDTESVRTIERAIDLGVTFFDVAPVYGYGHAEEVLGRALRGKRDSVVVASKCGLLWDDAHATRNCLKPESVKREIEDTLRRLGTDHVDLYQLHWPDPSTPIEETMEALDQIRRQGKIIAVGVSNFPVSLTQRAMSVGRVSSQQCLYNVLERNETSYHSIPLEYRTEEEVLPFCAEHDQAFFPYSPLCQGLLTGTFRAQDNFDEHDVRSQNPKLRGSSLAYYLSIVDELEDLARRIGHPLNEVALNWLISHPEVTSVIAGAQTPSHVEANVASAEWDLDAESMKQIDRIVTRR